jgi:endonuclease-3 related protein
MADNRYIAQYLRKVYKKLYTHFGPQHWWPAKSAFEVIIGAILTQNTAWVNVQKAIICLRKKKLLNPKRLYRINHATLAEIIRPCGYYNVKANRVKSFLRFLFDNFQGNLSSLFKLDLATLREKLLSIKGIGPETADSILLYAAKKPIFVVDAYTKRFLWRHQMIKKQSNYQQVQSLFEESLPHQSHLFNEYHALIVRLAKDYCRKKPLCEICPLAESRHRSSPTK